MFRGKSRKCWSIATFLVAALLLQGCSSVNENAAPEPTESPVAVKPHRYNPSLSPAFAEPWPTNVTRKEMIDTALFKSFEFLGTMPQAPCEVKVNTYLEESMGPDQIELIETTSRRMIELFCDYLSEDLHVIGGDYDFVKEIVAQEGLWSDKFGGICGYDVKYDAGTACAAYDVAWIGQQVGTTRRGEFVPEPARVTFLTHELFHVIHDDIDPKPGPNIPGPGTPLFRPVWLVEGAGQFFGSIVPKYLQMQDYQTFLPYDSYGQMLKVEYLSDLKKQESILSRNSGEHYYSGLVAHEYIAASVGLAPLLDIWVRMDKGDSFERAFEKATDISVKEFYKKFAEMHDNLYEGEFVE